MKISLIKPYEKNAKVHDKRQVAQIAASITEFGFNQPIVVDAKGVIIVGHGRYEAAKLLGMTDVPAITAKLTTEQAKAYRLADNKLNESEWDMKLVVEELKELSDKMFEITGFSKDVMSAVQEDNFDGQKAYDAIKKPTAKRGDVYQLGDHRLMCGDSTSIQDFQILMDGKKGAMIFTDPPYAVDYKVLSSAKKGFKKSSTEKYDGTGGKIVGDDMGKEEATKFFEDVARVLVEVTEDRAPLYWWYSNSRTIENRTALDRGGGWHISQEIVWVKNSPVFSPGNDFHRQCERCLYGWKEGKKHFANRKMSTLRDVFTLEFSDFKEAIDNYMDVWYQHRDDMNKYVHPTQKPIRLAERALKKSSASGDIIIDAFAGSGSTLMACEQMNRPCFTMELDPKYIMVVIQRWELFTGKKAKLVT